MASMSCAIAGGSGPTKNAKYPKRKSAKMRIARMLAYSEGRASATYLPRLLRLKRIGITWMFSFIAIDARTK